MVALTAVLTTASSWAPWWEQVNPGESITVTVTFTGSGEFGLLAGPGGTPPKWLVDKRTRTQQLAIVLPPTTGGLWRCGLYARSGSATARVTVATTPTKNSLTTTATGGAVPLYRLTQRIGDLPPGTVVRRKGVAATTGDDARLSSAFWTNPLADDAPLAATSVAWSKRLADQASSMISGTPFSSAYTGIYGTRTSTDNHSITVYRVPIDTPRQKVWSRSDKYYMDGSTRVSFRDVLDHGVPLPDPSVLVNNLIEPAGTDGSAIVVCGVEAWELWRVAAESAASKYPNYTPAPDGYAWSCTQGGYIADITKHPGWWAGSGGENAPKRGGDFGVSAAGMSYLGPILTGADFYADEIRHPLAVALPATGGYGTAEFPYFVFPATRGDRLGALRPATDGTSGDTVKLPEGARFRLLPDPWTNRYIDAYAAAKGVATPGPKGSTPTTLAKVLRAARDRGVLVADFGQVVGFSAESDVTYGTPYNPLGVAERPVWGNFGQQLPWGDFVQVAPPAATVAVQGWA